MKLVCQSTLPRQSKLRNICSCLCYSKNFLFLLRVVNQSSQQAECLIEHACLLQAIFPRIFGHEASGSFLYLLLVI